MKSNSVAAPFIGLQNLTLCYDSKVLFQNLSWSWTPGQWTCLLGQSGIGKSSLLRLIAGLLPDKIKIQGEVSRPQDLAYLGQNDALLPWLTVYENAILSASMGPYSSAEKENITHRARELLEQTGLAEVLNFYPRQLSGGMRQRLALVRALAEDKSYILMDEPFSRLDAITRHQLQDLAAELLKNKTVLLVTHDPQEALRLADQIDLLSGNPGSIETLACFSSSGPRELDNLEILNLQKDLYQTLSDHHQGPRLHQAPHLEVLAS